MPYSKDLLRLYVELFFWGVCVHLLRESSTREGLLLTVKELDSNYRSLERIPIVVEKSNQEWAYNYIYTYIYILYVYMYIHNL